ncbi:hypothetical protein ACFQ58_14170 [Agromyces sp. NPDC056523]|uniref:hypothetical protein n=1 Tax=Agromyces sp. NPDC056523 TaxID=3345850 RepID=UPI00366FB79A
MQRFDAVLRWMGAVGIVLAPFGLFVLPNLMHPVTPSTAEEQFTAIAEGGGAGEFIALMSQVGGAIFLLVAALAIGSYVIARRRGQTLGAIGLIIGAVAAIAMLLVLGFELAMLPILISATDTDAAVALVVDLSAGPAFAIPLMIGLVGFYFTLPLLALALWRTGLVPIIVSLLFVLPLLIGIIPLPFDVAILTGLLLLAPCLWMAVRLVVGPAVEIEPSARLAPAGVPDEA